MITISYIGLFWFLFIFYIIGTHVTVIEVYIKTKYKFNMDGIIFCFYVFLSIFILNGLTTYGR